MFLSIYIEAADSPCGDGSRFFVGWLLEARPWARSLHCHADRGQEGERRAAVPPLPARCIHHSPPGDREDKWLLHFVEASYPSFLSIFQMKLRQEQEGTGGHQESFFGLVPPSVQILPHSQKLPSVGLLAHWTSTWRGSLPIDLSWAWASISLQQGLK